MTARWRHRAGRPETTCRIPGRDVRPRLRENPAGYRREPTDTGNCANRCSCRLPCHGAIVLFCYVSVNSEVTVTASPSPQGSAPMTEHSDHRTYAELFIGGQWRKPANPQQLAVI